MLAREVRSRHPTSHSSEWVYDEILKILNFMEAHFKGTEHWDERLSQIRDISSWPLDHLTWYDSLDNGKTLHCLKSAKPHTGRFHGML